MKTATLVILLLCSYQLQAACRCTCSLLDRRMCASAYDIEHPCVGACPGQMMSTDPESVNTYPRHGSTACPNTQVMDPGTGKLVWKTICPNE